MNNDQIWEGISFPNRDFFKVPHDFIEAMARIDNLSELKVIIYVMRHTWGFQEYEAHKKITTDEFMHGRKRNDGSRMDRGTGLSNRSIIDGIEKARKHGFLECEVSTKDAGRIEKSYRLKMREAPTNQHETSRQAEKGKKHQHSH